MSPFPKKSLIAAVLLLTLSSCSSRPGGPLGAPPLEVDEGRTSSLSATPVGYTVVAPAGKVWETTIAISPANPNIAVAAGMRRARPIFRVQPYWSEDGGRTWQPSERPSLVSSKATYDGQGDPVVAFDRTGTAYLVTLVKVGTEYERSGIMLWRSTDGGRTWGAPRPVVERQREYFDDKEWIGIDTSGGPRDGTIYLAWLRTASTTDASGAAFIFTRSTDGGLSWSPEKVMPAGGGQQFAMGPNGEIHIIYAVGGRHMKSITSTDGGETFSEPVPITTLYGPNGFLPNTQFFLYPFASADADRSDGPYRGHLYTVWAGSADAYPKGGNSLPGTIWFSRSTNAGQSWTPPARISRPVGRGDAMLPSLSCDPASGAVVVAWLDRSDDPQNQLARVFTAVSYDGGVSFSEPMGVTSPVDVSEQSFIGHYNGTAARAGVWLTAFSDSTGHMGIARIDDPRAKPVRRRGVRR